MTCPSPSSLSRDASHTTGQRDAPRQGAGPFPKMSREEENEEGQDVEDEQMLYKDRQNTENKVKNNIAKMPHILPNFFEPYYDSPNLDRRSNNPGLLSVNTFLIKTSHIMFSSDIVLSSSHKETESYKQKELAELLAKQYYVEHKSFSWIYPKVLHSLAHIRPDQAEMVDRGSGVNLQSAAANIHLEQIKYITSIRAIKYLLLEDSLCFFTW